MSGTPAPRALVVFPGALGDFVCLLPALAELRRRGFERIVLMCKSDLAPLVAASGVAEHVPIEGRAASWMYAADPSHETEEFYGTFESIDSFSGAGVIEVEENLRRWNGRVHAFRPTAPVHLAVHFMTALFEVSPPIDELRAAIAVAPDALDLAPPRLLIHPGSGGRQKRWSRSGFREIAARRARGGGSAAVVLGPAESGEAGLWSARGLRVIDGADTLGVASLLAAADLYLGNDSGVSHLAGAVGARGVALFGPTDPMLWRPLSRRIDSLRLEPWSGCEEDAPAAAIDRVERALDRAGRLA